MPLVVFSLLVQAALVIHILKTGRDTKWLYIVLIFPAVGAIAYIVVELLPEWTQSRTAQQLNRALVDKIDPGREVRRHTEAVSISPTVDNLLNLAEELVRKQQYAEALVLYQQARAGLYTYDPKIMLAQANAYFLQGDYAQTKTLLDEIKQHNPDFKSPEGHLLYARALEQLGEIAAAAQEYQVLCQYYAGPEPKCRYAQLLVQQSQVTEARALYEEVLITARRQGKSYQRFHQSWIKMAAQALNKLEKT